ncbi:MAG: hypothetical protein JXQ84_02550 [Rhodospirillaceae bacterium]|nr:hypothetical protein [Rhodospirillaceae bacterium]
MNAWMISAGYAGSLACCSVWAREWARRKGLNSKVWGVAGATTGPLGVIAVGFWRARASLCPHCLAPMSFDARYCPTCRARERGEIIDRPRQSRALPFPRRARVRLDGDRAPVAARRGGDVLFGHGFFETPAVDAPVHAG